MSACHYAIVLLGDIERRVFIIRLVWIIKILRCPSVVPFVCCLTAVDDLTGTSTDITDMYPGVITSQLKCDEICLRCSTRQAVRSQPITDSSTTSVSVILIRKISKFYSNSSYNFINSIAIGYLSINQSI